MEAGRLWRRLGLSMAVALVASGMWAGAASGRVLLVCGGSSTCPSGHYPKIQSAVNAAHAGDWVLVWPGDYHEAGSNNPSRSAGLMVKTSGIHLRGMDRNRVLVDGTLPSAARPCSPLGADQNLGPLDTSGQPSGRSGVVVLKASGVSVENLTACNFLTGSSDFAGNEIWFNGGDGSGQIGMHGYRGDYITATSTYSNGVDHPRGEYGIFASNADGPGTIDHSYASNMGDAAYYIGACPDCNATLVHAHAQFSALGYSGTNSGGNLTITDSEFDHNKTGLTSNSQNNDDQPSPQIGLCPAGSSPSVSGAVGCTIIRDNAFHDNNNPNVPGAAAGGLAGGAPVGAGVVLAGTRYITLYRNQVTGNGSWGALVTDLPDQENAPDGFPNCTGGTWIPATGVCYYNAFGNFVWDNTFQGNGGFGNPTNGDIGLSTEVHDPGNCFHGNVDPDQPGHRPTSDPPNIQDAPYYPCGQPNGGDMGPLAAEALCATQLLFPCPGVPGANYPRTTEVQIAMPPDQPSMPNPCSGVPDNPWCRNGQPTVPIP